MARFTQPIGSGGGGTGPTGPTGPQGDPGADGADGLDSLFLGTWNSVTEFLAAYQGGPVGLADGDWWAFVKDNSDPNKIYVVREDPNSATGWVIDDNEHFDLPAGPQGDPGTPGADGSDGAQGDPGLPGADGNDGTDALWNYLGEYNGGLIYTAGDIVTYDGQLWYRNVYTSAGYTPGGPEGYWDLLAAKGNDGADGADGTNGADGANGNDGSPGLVYLGNYVLGNGYLANVAVVKGSDNNLYIATSSGGLGDPVGNTAEWAIFLPKGADGAQGDPGPQGDPGADGQDGADANLDTGTTTINSYNPVWSGTGLAYTNTPATGSYIKIGNLVTVQIDVLFTNVSNFGTGAYSLTLPVASKYHTDVYGGSIHKITNQGIDHYSLKGHLSPTSSSFTLWVIGSSAADQAFNNNTPVNIDTDDKFHMSFSYICE
jgi:hypothetical protein